MTSPGTLPLGSRVADYRLDRLLGTGGFGAVFAATDVGTGHCVALKVLDSAVIDRLGGDARFAREAQLARRLDHPNVVRVVEDGHAADGTRFIAFELLDGRSLSDEIKKWGAMQPRRAVTIVLSVLDALEAAHATGIVHRDLKPANVYLLTGSDHVKVLDFGIAKSTNPNTLVGLTQEGLMLGTPMYMAPEQIAGSDVSPGTDLFTLGLVLLEMLLGESPYPRTMSAMQLVRARFSGQPVPIPDAIAQTPLGAVIRRATQLDVEDRFPSAAAMTADLQAALSDPRFRDAVIHTGGKWSPTSVSAVTGATPNFAAPTAHSGAYPPSPSAQAPSAHSGAYPPAATPVSAWPVPQPPAAPAPPFTPQQQTFPSPGAHRPPSAQPPPHDPRWGGPGPALAPPREPMSNLGLMLVGAAFFAVFIAVGVGLGVWAMAPTAPERPGPVRTSPKRTEPGPQPQDDDATPPVVAPPIPPPTKLPSTQLRPCRRASRIAAPELKRALTTAGWTVSGTLSLCTGNLINFRCDSGEGKGWTAERGRDRAQVVVLRFSSPQAASTWVAAEGKKPSFRTLAGPDGRSVLYVNMPSKDADALVGRVCGAR
jgi:serine/threonine protein kinase